MALEFAALALEFAALALELAAMQLRGHFGGMVNVGAHGAAIVCGDEKSAGKSSAIRNGAVRYSEWRTFPVQMEIP